VELADNLDTMAVVVDWLDCCRSCDLDALLDLYAEDAGLECACEGIWIKGHEQLAAYWKSKLSGMSPGAFVLEEITPHGNGVALDYLSFESRPVRILFGFDPSGKISHMRCEPAAS
jgi:ketosteroid isomerase-like protein